MPPTAGSTYWTIATHLDRTADRWAEFRQPVADIGNVLRRAFDSLRLAA
jgi:hypothetical protein